MNKFVLIIPAILIICHPLQGLSTELYDTSANVVDFDQMLESKLERYDIVLVNFMTNSCPSCIDLSRKVASKEYEQDIQEHSIYIVNIMFHYYIDDLSLSNNLEYFKMICKRRKIPLNGKFYETLILPRSYFEIKGFRSKHLYKGRQLVASVDYVPTTFKFSKHEEIKKFLGSSLHSIIMDSK